MTSLLLRSICCSAPRFYSSSSSSYRSTNPLKSSLLHRIPGLTRHFSAAKDSAASRCRSCNPTLTIPSEVFYLSCIDPLKCDPVVQRFEQWLSRYGRNYKDKTEWYYRFGIYQSNLDFINGYNSENKSSKLVDNQFADMTNDEFRADYCGLRVPNQLKRYNLMHKMTTNAPDSAPDSAPNHAPHSVDWRKYGAVTYVKHEEHYGTSWAFAAVATVEGLHMIKTDRLFLLSAQQIIDGYTKNRGCIYGGSVEEAFKYIKANGLTGEASYLYGRTCKNNKGSKTIASISGHEYVPPNDEKILRDAVAKQPICAMVDSSSMAFRLYESGILKGFGGTNLDHFVTIVGYGGSGNNKYWIAKNSWGKEWGEDGYIRIRRDVKYKEGLLGIAMEASYPLA